jgi:hypothetical protein
VVWADENWLSSILNKRKDVALEMEGRRCVMVCSVKGFVKNKPSRASLSFMVHQGLSIKIRKIHGKERQAEL